MLARPRIRQLSLGELLDESFRIYRHDLLTLIALAALIVVPYTILNTLIALPLQQELATFQDPAAFAQDDLTEDQMNQMLSGIFFSSLLSVGASIGIGMLYTVIFQPIMEGAITRAVTRRYLDQPVSVGDSIGVAIRRGFALIGARLIPSLIVFTISLVVFGGLFLLVGGAALFSLFQANAQNDGGVNAGSGLVMFMMITMFCLLPLFALLVLACYVRILFTSQSIIAEGRGPLEALRRSWNLTKGYFWRTFGFYLVITIITALITGVPSAIVGTLVAVFVENLVIVQLINGGASAIASLLVTPFTLIALTLMYFDLRIRKEGFDLEQQARSLMPEYGNSAYGQPFSS